MNYPLEIVKGVEGLSVYLNDNRIAGPKPWGGGKVVKDFSVDEQAILDAIGFAPPRQVDENAFSKVLALVEDCGDLESNQDCINLTNSILAALNGFVSRCQADEAKMFQAIERVLLDVQDADSGLRDSTGWAADIVASRILAALKGAE